MRTMSCLPRPRSFCSSASAFCASSSDPPARFRAASALFFVVSADARTRSGVFSLLAWALLISGTTRVYGHPDDTASVAPPTGRKRPEPDPAVATHGAARRTAGRANSAPHPRQQRCNLDESLPRKAPLFVQSSYFGEPSFPAGGPAQSREGSSRRAYAGVISR